MTEARTNRLKKILGNTSLLAALIAIAAVVWIFSGMLHSEDKIIHDTIADKNGTEEESKALVRTRQVALQEVEQNIRLTGRTIANRHAALAAETFGAVIALPVERGSIVKKDDVLIRLAVNEKRERVREAEKAVQQADIELRAAKRLLGDGYSTPLRVASNESALEAARAQLQRARIDLQNTEIRAPFDGVLQERHVDLGDYLRDGDPAAIILQMDPIRVVGFATENQRPTLNLGRVGYALLSDGTEIEGALTYISSQADQETRTFRVELSVPNPDLRLVEGMTTQMVMKGEKVQAHFISSSWLVLNDAGEVGVRGVQFDEQSQRNKVVFYPVQILQGDGQGLWVQGLPVEVEIITVGQAFVVEGQKVRVDVENAPESDDSLIENPDD